MQHNPQFSKLVLFKAKGNILYRYTGKLFRLHTVNRQAHHNVKGIHKYSKQGHNMLTDIVCFKTGNFFIATLLTMKRKPVPDI